MSKQVIFENDKFVVWYHPATKIVHHEVLAFPNDGSLRKALEAGVSALEKHGGVKWLSDDHAVAGLPPEDLAWGVENWEPRMLALGWSHWAIVTPKKAMGQLTLKRIASDYAEKGVTVRFFTSATDAMAWIESQ